MNKASGEQHSYKRGAGLFQEAARGFGINVAVGQVEEWRCMLEASFFLDHILDSSMPQTEREAEYNRCISAFFAVSLEELAIPEEHLGLILRMRQLVVDWPDHKVDKIIKVAELIKEIALQKRLAVSARQLGKLALYEGAETARLLEVESSTTKAEDFNRWLEMLLRFGVVVDSAVDLPEDCKNGLTQVAPTWSNRLIIGSYALSLLPPLVRQTPKNQYRPLLAAARSVVDDSNKEPRFATLSPTQAP